MYKTDEHVSEFECCEKGKWFQVFDKVSLRAKMNILFWARNNKTHALRTKECFAPGSYFFKGRSVCTTLMHTAFRFDRDLMSLITDNDMKSKKFHLIILLCALRQPSLKRKRKLQVLPCMVNTALVGYHPPSTRELVTNTVHHHQQPQASNMNAMRRDVNQFSPSQVTKNGFRWPPFSHSLR